MRKNDGDRLAELRKTRNALGDLACCVALTVTSGVGYILVVWHLSWMLAYRW